MAARARFSDGKPTRKWMADHDKKVFESKRPSIGMGTIFISESERREREREREREERRKRKKQSLREFRLKVLAQRAAVSEPVASDKRPIAKNLTKLAQSGIHRASFSKNLSALDRTVTPSRPLLLRSRTEEEEEAKIDRASLDARGKNKVWKVTHHSPNPAELLRKTRTRRGGKRTRTRKRKRRRSRKRTRKHRRKRKTRRGRRHRRRTHKK